MNERYAVFIWISYALGLAVVVWNVLAPMLRRAQLLKGLKVGVDEEGEQ